MSQMSINYYAKIIDVIQSQFDSMPSFEGKVEVFDEQVYMKKDATNRRPMERGKYYVTVNFGRSTSNLWQVNLPITLTILCEKNKFENAKYLFTEYVLKYNISDITVDGNYRYLQYYSTPAVSRSFADIGNGFFTMMTLSGQFLFGLDSDFISQILYTNSDENTEIVKFIGANIALNAVPDSQPFPDIGVDQGSNQLAKTVNTFGTLVIGMSTFLIKNSLLLRDLKSLLKPTRDMNRDFTINIIFSEEVENAKQVTTLPSESEVGKVVLLLTDGRYYKCTGLNSIQASIWQKIEGDSYIMKVSGFNIEQKLGELTNVSMSFAH